MKVSFIHIGFQILILAYILIYGLYVKKGYQRTGAAAGSSSTKVQGTGYSESILPWFGPQSEPTFQFYDSYDLRSPPLENSDVFLTTNMWVTRNQTRGECISYDAKNSCDESHPCRPLVMTNNGRQMGGECLYNFTDPQQLWPTPKGGFCKVFGWCPSEYEIDNSPFALLGVESSTIFTRMDVHYPDFHQHLDNSGGIDALTPGLNTWTFEEMVRLAGHEWKAVNTSGILLAMESTWDCDFDHGVDSCSPKIRFFRLDDPNSKLSSGFNFRTVEFLHDKIGARELTKHYGVRLLILMSGVGSQSDPVAALTAIGAGIGLLSVATLIADIISTKLLSQKNLYNSVKYKEVSIEDPNDLAGRLFDKIEDEAEQLAGLARQLTTRQEENK